MSTALGPRSVAFLGALAAFAPSLARAEPSRDPAAAEELFQRAKELLKRDDWGAACPKFEASMALDPAVGTLLKIAKCHEHDGKLALALSDYQTAITLNQSKSDQTPKRRDELAAFAKSALAQLEPRVPKLEITVADPPEGLHVARDDHELPVAALRERLPVDPGSHEIVVEAPGFEPERRHVEIAEGELVAIKITLRRRESSPAPPTPTPADAGAGAAPPRGTGSRALGFALGGVAVASLGVAGFYALRGDDGHGAPTAAAVSLAIGTVLVGGAVAAFAIRRNGPSDDQRTLALVAAGIGVASIAVGTAFAIRTEDKWSSAESNHCHGTVCDQEGAALTDDAKRAANVATVASVIGGASLAAGVALWFTAGSTSTKTASWRVRPGLRDVALEATF